MEQQELANELQDMYNCGEQKGKGEVVAHIILFGIKYAEELKAAKQAGCSIADIITLSGLRESRNLEENTYTPEINNGMKLAQYVELKQ